MGDRVVLGGFREAPYVGLNGMTGSIEKRQQDDWVVEFGDEIVVSIFCRTSILVATKFWWRRNCGVDFLS